MGSDAFKKLKKDLAPTKQYRKKKFKSFPHKSKTKKLPHQEKEIERRILDTVDKFLLWVAGTNWIGYGIPPIWWG